MAACRFCKEYDIESRMVTYAPRCNAHFRCYLKGGKPLAKLRAFQIGKFPVRVLDEFGVREEADRILTEHEKRSGRPA